MKTATRTLAVALAALCVAAGSAQANGRHGHHHGHHWPGHGLFWGAVGFGVGLGMARGYYYGDPRYSGYVMVAPPPPVAYYDDEARPYGRGPASKAPPDPIIYPRDGQSTARTEADRQACNRWATTQPSAMADARVFHRATIACMEGRGYTVR